MTHAMPAGVPDPGRVMGGPPTRCATARITVWHRPARFVWHHIQPQAAGGATVRENLAGLCDNCHYMVHVLMWRLAHGADVGSLRATRAQQRLARQGLDACTAAGTVDRIPKEAA